MKFNAETFKLSERQTNTLFISLAEFSKVKLSSSELINTPAVTLYNDFLYISENRWFAEKCQENADIAAFLLQTFENIKAEPLYIIPYNEYTRIIKSLP